MVVACVAALVAVGAAAGAGVRGADAPAAAVAGGPAAAAVLLQPMPAAWLRECRASAARPACPALVQRSKLWADSDAVRTQDVVASYGVTSYIVYADVRHVTGKTICAEYFDGVTHDYSRMTPACHARYAPGKGLVVWASISVGPILGTVHTEWHTGALRPAQVRDGVAARHGAIPLDFGPLTWGSRSGRLLLGPHGLSEELVFVWGKGSTQRGVGIQVFEPLTQAVATLRALVASVPRG